jgi:hypothetical protein
MADVDFLIHGKIRIAAGADAIWPHVLDPSGWQTQRLVHAGGEPGEIGERFHAVAAADPTTPLFHVETVELAPLQRRTIRLTALDGTFLGYSTWALTEAGDETVVAYDVYCRYPAPPGGAPADVTAQAQRGTDENMLRLKALVEN